MCWFEKNKRLYSREYDAVKNNFPKLKFYRSNNLLAIKGEIDLVDDKDVLDTYQIAIVFPPSYPADIPELIETGGRIPRILDRHINNKSTCCIGPRLEQIQIWLKDPTIHAYITQSVIPFLANQSYYERVGEWKNGQYDHGAGGVLSYYAESYGLTDRKLVETILNYLANNQKLGRNDPCFCESGKKTKKCHLEVYNNLRSKGSPELFEKDLGDLKKDTKAQDEKSLNSGHFK